MQSIVNKLFYLHLFGFCFHFMALLYKSGKFINISCMLIRILTLNAVYHKDVFIYLEPLLEYQLST